MLPAPAATAGKSLNWCKSAIESVIGQGPTVFKIGLTGCPMFRFYKKPCHTSPSPGYFYDRDKYQKMLVLFAGATFDECALMEAALISCFLNKQGCRNVNPGGEGRKVYDPPYFTYLVYRSRLHPPNKR